ncbi:MAG: TIGR03545 family protein [Idiomarina sp.]|nr:TIGR03545 family protein [Idiomarina sp.]
MKAIRWPGLITFLAIVGGLTLFIVVFIDGLVRVGLSAGLSRVNGAEVNIASVDLNWSPFSVTLQELQITDPEVPELNRFAAEELRAEVMFWDLFIGRVHITDLRANGITFGSERAQAGRVRATERDGEDAMDWRDRLAQFDIQLPGVEEVLGRADIRTPALSAEAEERFEARERAFRRVREELPSTSKVEDYQKRFEALSESRPRTPQELNRAREQFRELQRGMRDDRERVNAFLEVSREGARGTQEDIEALRNAYQHDLDRARALFSADQGSLTELTGILFGAQVQQWAEYGFMVFDFIAPLLQSAQEDQEQPSRWAGRFIDFDRNNRPTFLVENAELSLGLEVGDIRMQIRDLTWQHAILGRPSTFELSSADSPWWRALRLDGDLFIGAEGSISGGQRWALEQARLDDLALVEQRQFSAALQRAVLNSQGELRIDGGALRGQGRLLFTEAAFATGGEASWARYFEQALQGIQRFDIDLGVRGELARPRLSLQSDLDNQLASIMNRMVREEADLRLASVRTELNETTQRLQGELQPWLERAQAIQSQATDYESKLTELLRVEFDELIRGDSDRLLNRIRTRVGG